MKQEKLISLASVLGWFGAYLLISIFSGILPDIIDNIVTVIAIWGLIFLSARLFEGKRGIVAALSHGGVRAVAPMIPIFALLAGAGLNLMMSGLLPLLPLPDSIVDSYNDASSYLSDPDIYLFLETVLIVPLLEETVYRGLIADRLGRALPIPIAVVAASLIFAVMHGTLIWICYAFVSAIIINTIYFRCRSTLPCMAFHLAFNFANYIWEMIFHLPDESWAHILCLVIGTVFCTLFIVLIFFKTGKESKEKIKKMNNGSFS